MVPREGPNWPSVLPSGSLWATSTREGPFSSTGKCTVVCPHRVLLSYFTPEERCVRKRASQEDTNPYYFLLWFFFNKRTHFCTFFLKSLKSKGASSWYRWGRGSKGCQSSCVLLKLFQNSECTSPRFDLLRTEFGHFPDSSRSWLTIITWVTGWKSFFFFFWK